MAFDAGLDACTRCGLCLQACPTYRELGMEADSPRGRVFLMKQAQEGSAGALDELASHLYVCLGCRACETACPSGVPYGTLLEEGRRLVETRAPLSSRNAGWRAFRRIAFGRLLPQRSMFETAMAPARALASAPVMRALVERLPLPGRIRSALNMLPESDDLGPKLPAVVPPPGDRRARVGIFIGCVMGSLFGGVHASLARVLRRIGCEIVNPPGQWCCGALNVHAGERDRALAMARRNIDAFDDASLDAIVVDAAGCGAHLKSYGRLLADETRYADRARRFASRVKDATELIYALGLSGTLGMIDERVTYLDACHLLHGQRISEQPRALLRAIPGLELVEMAEAGRCCGAAGVYSLTHPQMSEKIRDEALDRIEATGATTVAVSNPGCHMQVLAGARARGSPLRVKHVVQLLDASYAASGSAER